MCKNAQWQIDEEHWMPIKVIKTWVLLPFINRFTDEKLTNEIPINRTCNTKSGQPQVI